LSRKHLVVLAAVLVAVAVALGFFWPFGKAEPVLRLPGVVEIQEVRLASKVGGRVAEVKVLEGDVVQPGRELVAFEAPELKAQLEQARARRDNAAANLARLEHGSRPQEIAQAQAQTAEREATLGRAREDFRRAQRMLQSRSISQEEYDRIQALLREAESQVNSARASQKLVEIGPRDEDKDAARAQLAEARARVAELEANLAETVVHAPEEAVVQVVAVRKGDVVPPNQPVVRVLRAEDLWVRIYVPETELGKVYVGQPAEVTVDTYPGRRFAGQVIQVSAESEFTPRNVQSPDERRHQVFGVKVRVDDPQGVFKAGMAAEVVLPVQK
jgi:multidrug resistance efflux pump